MVNLLELPHELQLNIFKQYNKVASPICKSLLPFTRAPIFKFIKIKSAEQFNSFAQTILKDTSVGPLVIELDVTIGVDDPSETVEIDHILAVLKHLINVTVLKIHWEWLSTIVCSRLVASSSLPQLKCIILIDPFQSQSDPWNKQHFQYLFEYQALYQVCLKSGDEQWVEESVEVKSGEIMSSDKLLNEKNKEKRVQDKREAIEKVQDWMKKLFLSKTKELDGEVVEYIPRRGRQLLTIRTRLINRSLIDTILSFGTSLIRISETLAESPDFTPVMKELTPKLEGLHFIKSSSILSSSRLSIPETTDFSNHIYPAITRFVNLRSLTISARLFTPKIFNYLRNPLPLSQLFISKDTQVKISDLKRLLLPGPAKLSALKTLTLDNVYGKVSAYRVAKLGPYYNENSGEFDIHPGWILPKWSNDFSESGLVELKKLCEQQHVVIKGSSLNCIGIKTMWEQEVNLAEDLSAEMDSEGGMCEECEYPMEECACFFEYGIFGLKYGGESGDEE